MTPDLLLLSFALAFLGCVVAIPLVRWIADRSGAVDRPDEFRRVHKVAIPRLGGLGLGLGLGLSFAIMALHPATRAWTGYGLWVERQAAVAIAALIVLTVGAMDDARGLRPGAKLAGQAAAVLVLFAGGIRIARIDLLGITLPLSAPIEAAIPVLGTSVSIDLPSLAVTLVWFLACMNIWNLIDGLDGLASGVGILVCSTFMLVAIHQGNTGSAMLGAALAGSLAGFLLFNWHPACIFLGDSGSLVLGMLIGVMGVGDAQQEGSGAVAILTPILAMGLPISDTAMAIVRRWVRGLPLSAADRRHVHHLLIGLGLSTRQAALVLYVFTAGLCGVVLLGVAWRNELLALGLGLSGCVAFLLVLTSRRDELARIVSEFRGRGRRKRLEREAAKVTWERVQRIELAENPDRVRALIIDTARVLECEHAEIHHVPVEASPAGELRDIAWSRDESDAMAIFRLVESDGSQLALAVGRSRATSMDSDIVFRVLDRLVVVGSQRMRELRAREMDPLLDVAGVALRDGPEPVARQRVLHPHVFSSAGSAVTASERV
jgi:UDP-GlcNAc:undecaprenyl-phosphate GlcNAc-1-phosphate transferase